MTATKGTGRSLRSTLAGLAIALSFSVACSQPAPTSSAPSAAATAAATAAPVGGPIVQRINGDWPTLDPFDGTSTAAQIMAAVYDRLVTFEGGKIAPYLAASWQQTPTSITFKLRTDATCSDGSKVTASLVVENWKRMLNPAKRSVNAGAVLGPGPFTFSSDDTAATATMTLGQPASDAIYAFTNSSFGAVVCSKGLANTASLVDTPSGSGPFTIASAVHGDAIRLKARPDWAWGPSGVTAKTAGFPQELVYKVLTNETTVANLLLTGGLDVAIVNGPDVQRLRNDKSVTSQKAVPYTSDVVHFNEDPARLTSDKAVRQALSTAIDPAAWNQAANNGEGLATTSVITPNAPCFDPETTKLVPTPSVDKAKEILRSAGWTADPQGKLSKDGKPLALKVLTNTTQGAGPEYLFDAFMKVGATVTLDKPDRSQFATKFRASDFDVTVGQWSIPTPGPSQIIGPMAGPFPPTGLNIARIQDAELQKAVTAAQASVGDEQCKNWSAAQRRLLEQSHVFPLPGQVTTIFARTGFSFTPNSSIFLEPYLLRSPAAK